jgi:hypothetical protein
MPETHGLGGQADVLDHHPGHVRLHLEPELVEAGDGDGQLELAFTDPLGHTGRLVPVELVDGEHGPGVEQVDEGAGQLAVVGDGQEPRRTGLVHVVLVRAHQRGVGSDGQAQGVVDVGPLVEDLHGALAVPLEHPVVAAAAVGRLGHLHGA